MGWVTEKFSDGLPTNAAPVAPGSPQTFEASAEKTWKQLTSVFEADVREINSRKGDADFKELSDHEIRISSTLTKIDVVVTVDFSAHTIHYVYEPEDAQTAVPEQGVLTMRPSDSGIRLFSADQHVTSDQASRLILEPLFFVNPPLSAAT